jgi:hypothetical protein
LYRWQASYENNWHKHYDVDYLKDFKFPIFGNSIDSLESVLEALTLLINKYKEYTQKHTELLEQALLWEKRQYQTECLLVGHAREEAEKWLLQEFVSPEQPPCVPSNLVAEFISDSKKNAENLFTDIFISYSSKNKEMQQQIYFALLKKGITIWDYKQDISKTEDAEQATWRGLEQADNLVILLSNYSLQADFCWQEITKAFGFNKRVIPILIEQLNNDSKAKLESFQPLFKLQPIDFTDNRTEEDFQHDISILIKEVYTNKRYHQQHKIFLVQALRWERQQRNPSILLRGYNLENAKTWLQTAKSRTEQTPTLLHEEFINDSLAKIGQLDSDAFISYSRNNSDFARSLNEYLQLYGKSTWFDQESIASGADFQQEIYRGIAESANFIFLISPSAIVSPYCEDEIRFAHQQGKRFIPLLADVLDTVSMEKFKQLSHLSEIQWIDCTNKDFYTAFTLLIRALDTDKEYVEQHTKWQKKATEAIEMAAPTSSVMNTNGVELTVKFKSELLLRGNELVLAHVWLDNAINNHKSPVPTELQKEFVAVSEQLRLTEEAHAKEITKSLRNRFRIAVATAAVAIATSIIALYYYQHAQEQKAKAVYLMKEARKEQHKAQKSRRNC